MKLSLRILCFLSGIFTLSLIVIVAGCSSGPTVMDEIKSSSHHHDLETVVVLGTNDIHGAMTPENKKTREKPGAPSISYERGGFAIFASHVKLLRQEFKDHLILLDAGDEFQGSLESNIEEGASIVRLFNSIGLNAATTGNHEFDFGPAGPEGTEGDPLGALKARMTEAKYPYVMSNIADKATGKIPGLPQAVPHVLLTVGRLKVGVIGLSTLETPGITRGDAMKALVFTDPRNAVIREAKALRNQGAQMVILNTHMGLKCNLDSSSVENHIRRPAKQDSKCDNDEVVRLLDTLPPNTVDAVVSGHTHQIVHHWINNVPVIQAGTRNQYYNLIYLTYDWTDHRVLPQMTRIEGPIPICEKVFENQNDCNGERPTPADGRGDLIEPTLHGKTITPDPQTQVLLKPVLERLEKEKKRVIGHAARSVEHPQPVIRESEMGNLVTDAIRQKLKADVALVNPGGLRASFEAGPVTYEMLFRTLPFDNTITLLTVTGKELKTILRVAENGSRGFFPVSGISLKLIPADLTAPSDDLNEDGKEDIWETNRLVEARLDNGSLIQDNKKYKLATIDYLVKGGDNMNWPMNQIPADRIQLNAGGVLRDAVQEYLEQHSPINTVEQPLINPAKPRFILLKDSPYAKNDKATKTKNGKKKKRHSKKHRR